MTKTEFKHKVFSHSEKLFPMVSRILGSTDEAQDAIQEIMMKLWLKRNEIKGHPNITGFVFLTARNHCIDSLRKRKIEINDSPYQLEILQSRNGQEQLEWKELEAVIKKIVINLPTQQREVIIMRDLDGYEFSEIAAATKLKIEHIRVLLSRARKEVRLQLEKTYNYGRR